MITIINIIIMTSGNMPGERRGSSASCRFLIFVALILFALAVFSFHSSAAPTGAGQIISGTPQKYNNNLTPTTVEAEAGNVTQLLINTTRLTRRWQGFYGNLTGNVVLSDARNNSIYSWQLVPSGEVYASNKSSVDWNSIKCANFSSNLSDGWTFNISTLESFYGAGSADIDGIDETFNNTYSNASGFSVGTKVINSQSRCPLAYTFVNGAYQQHEYEELLLTDNSSIIYTTLLENRQPGFNSQGNDFQLLVAENGDDPSPTSYYFFVELS